MSVLPETTRKPLVAGRNVGTRIHVLGAEITVKISSAATNGAFTVFEACTAPDQGPPLHRHHDHDEWWYILEGEYRFVVDNREFFARAGDTVYAPRGSSHTLQCVGNGMGRTLTTVVPGGIDTFFLEIEASAPRLARPDMRKLMPIFEKYRHELLGPPLSAVI